MEFLNKISAIKQQKVIVHKDKEAYSSLCYKHRTATGTHMPYGITQRYLPPPGRGDIPACQTPASFRPTVHQDPTNGELTALSRNPNHLAGSPSEIPGCATDCSCINATFLSTRKVAAGRAGPEHVDEAAKS